MNSICYNLVMLESRFIGREAELLQLRELAIHSKDKRGGVLFIEVPAGMGTSTLLKEFEDRAHRDLQLSETVFIGGECEQFTGTESAYHPFIEILEAFGKPENIGTIGRRTGSESYNSRPNGTKSSRLFL